MNNETVFANAVIVAPDFSFTGSLALSDGRVAALDAGGRAPAGALDCGGDFLMPGLIELHTDNLEKYVMPRPGINWPAPAASVIAHDNQVLGSGITTVLDAVALGFDDASDRRRILDRSVEAVGYAAGRGLLRADHFLHLRCEVASATAGDTCRRLAPHPLVRLVSVMDHTPGQRQWRDIDKWRTFHREKKWTDEAAAAVLGERRSLQARYAEENRRVILETAKAAGLPVASHDDTTAEHSRESHRLGVAISEFPTTLEAAREAGALGLKIVMGAPNMVRGESHSGNVSARALAAEGLLDGFSSDYMPISLLHAAFELHRAGRPLHRAVAAVTGDVAAMLKLDDRGTLAPGKKADLIRVRLVDGLPVVREVWKNGVRVFRSPEGA